MSQFHAFKDDARSQSIGELTVENGTDRVSIYGSLDITRDKAGLERARSLMAILDRTVHALEADANLPQVAAAPEQTVTVKNPFA